VRAHIHTQSLFAFANVENKYVGNALLCATLILNIDNQQTLGLMINLLIDCGENALRNRPQ